ncbi:peptide transporter ptr2 [Zalaria obscura]|uniref:Peptide transporter ptr2 n=1 Tax=Zalaria obscura TaxID=2024903 RepID=A0ACC3SAG2_9PEZI
MLCIVELAERASYYGVQTVFSNFMQFALPAGGNGAGAPQRGTEDTAGALGRGEQFSVAIGLLFLFLSYVVPTFGGYFADTMTGRFPMIMRPERVLLQRDGVRARVQPRAQGHEGARHGHLPVHERAELRARRDPDARDSCSAGGHSCSAVCRKGARASAPQETAHLQLWTLPAWTTRSQLPISFEPHPFSEDLLLAISETAGTCGVAPCNLSLCLDWSYRLTIYPWDKTSLCSIVSDLRLLRLCAGRPIWRGNAKSI